MKINVKKITFKRDMNLSKPGTFFFKSKELCKHFN